MRMPTASTNYMSKTPTRVFTPWNPAAKPPSNIMPGTMGPSIDLMGKPFRMNTPGSTQPRMPINPPYQQRVRKFLIIIMGNFSRNS